VYLVLIYFSFIITHYASTPVFLSTGGLTSHTCIFGHGGVCSGTTGKQVFWKGQRTCFFQTSEGLAASISTEPFRPSEAGFSDQITSDRVQTSFRYVQYREITPVNSLPAWEICILSKTLWVLDLAEPITDIHYDSCDSIDSVKRPAVLLLVSLITSTPYHPESGDHSEIAYKAILTILRAKQLEHGGSSLPAIPLA